MLAPKYSVIHKIVILILKLTMHTMWWKVQIEDATGFSYLKIW